MSTHSRSNRAALRAFVVIALSLLILAVTASDLRRLWHPLGVFGYTTDGDGVVFAVDENSPAARAGIQVGDRVDLRSTLPRFRPDVVQGTYVLGPGQTDTFGLVHRSIRRDITITSILQGDQNNLRKAFWIARFAAGVFFVLVGASLVLLKPSLTTWGFFFYCLGFTPGSWATAWTLFPFPGPYVTYALAGLLYVGGLVGVLIFALCFLAEPLSHGRRLALRLTPWLFVALVIFWSWNTYQNEWIGGPPGELFSRITFAVTALLSLLTLYVFIDTYVHARGTDRQRMRWVIIGFGISLSASFLVSILSTYTSNTPTWVLNSLSLCNVFVPLTVAYAVIKHRVIDVSFVISRALVYGVLTTFLVGAFSIIDWLFIEKMRLARLGTIMEMGVAVAGGVWFNNLHKGVDSFIDATFFRQRHQAERQLARDAAALPFSTTTKAVSHALIAEPVRTLSLASAALFRRGSNGAYLREESEGWTEADISKLDAEDDHLITLLQAENGPVSLYDHPWRSKGVPLGQAHLVLALPIIVRRELTAIVFYGAHIHGEALDPDEIKAIARLAPGAAAAYDHLDAEVMKREVESIRRENESLRTQLAEAQIQPA